MRKAAMHVASMLLALIFMSACVQFDPGAMKLPAGSSDAAAGQFGKKRASSKPSAADFGSPVTGSAATPTMAVTQPLLGIFSLQALIDFDVLDGAVVDPATGTVSLFGHKRDSRAVVPVPYLDYLATALESQSPIFSLEWTAASERQVDRALEMRDSELVEKLGNIFDANGRLTPIGEWWLQQGRAQVRAGMTRYEANSQVFAALGRTKEARALQLIGARDQALERGGAGQGGVRGANARAGYLRYHRRAGAATPGGADHASPAHGYDDAAVYRRRCRGVRPGAQPVCATLSAVAEPGRQFRRRARPGRRADRDTGKPEGMAPGRL
jgi:hypothetical protein